jgi:hypothetical protein
LIKELSSFDNFMEEEFIVIIELGFLGSNIKIEVHGVFIIKKFEKI